MGKMIMKLNNNKKRCIMIFPQFNNMRTIDRIREKYDPLFNKVKPHVTLVFPFESELTSIELEKHLIDTLKDTKAFQLVLKNIIKIDDITGLYLFLGIKEGNDNIKDIHTKLYSKILEKYKPDWLNHVEFMPHMTIGNFTNIEELNKAYEAIKDINEEFSTIVDKITVEIIDENENSIIELNVEINVGLENNL